MRPDGRRVTTSSTDRRTTHTSGNDSGNTNATTFTFTVNYYEDSNHQSLPDDVSLNGDVGVHDGEGIE